VTVTVADVLAIKSLIIEFYFARGSYYHNEFPYTAYKIYNLGKDTYKNPYTEMYIDNLIAVGK